MPIYLTVQVPGRDAAGGTVETHFDADVIVIGRAAEADVCLNAPVVSKRHAEIRRLSTGYHVVDLGSKNATFLGETKLSPDRPHALSEGDVIHVGGFSISVHFTSERGAEDEAGEAFPQNPFTEPVENLIQALTAIADAYDRDVPRRRDAALRDACIAAGGAGLQAKNPARHPGIQHVLSLLRLTASTTSLGVSSSRAAPVPPAPSPEGVPDDVPPSDDVPEEPPRSYPPAWKDPTVGDEGRADEEDGQSSADDEPEPFISPEALPNLSFLRSAEGTPPRDAARTVPPASSDDARRELVRAVSQLIALPWQFRREFVGHAVLPAPASAFLHEPPEALHEHLFGRHVDPDERGRRLAHLRHAVDAVAVHQAAMVEGYQSAVARGTARLMEELDPEVHAEAVRSRSWVYRMAPLLAASATLQRLRDRYDEMPRRADPQLFRPAFTKTYLRRMRKEGKR